MVFGSNHSACSAPATIQRYLSISLEASSKLRHSHLLTETSLETHDIAVPVPNTAGLQEQQFFRLILISSSDLVPLAAAMPRIERLYHQQGGRNCGILFLLQEKSPKDNGIMAFMGLQARYGSPYEGNTLKLTRMLSIPSNLEMPVLPLANLQSLLNTLFAFQRQLLRPAGSVARPNAQTALLPYCSTNPPMPEHARNVLGDICPSIPDLARAATTQDGQRGIQNYLSTSAGVADNVVGFWQEEFFVE